MVHGCPWTPRICQMVISAFFNRMKRYYACHCPFAKESILPDSVVSPVLCHCSLGHVMNFKEAFLGRELEGRVVHSVLNGNMTCEYEITISEDIMDSFVREREKKGL